MTATTVPVSRKLQIRKTAANPPQATMSQRLALAVQAATRPQVLVNYTSGACTLRWDLSPTHSLILSMREGTGAVYLDQQIDGATKSLEIWTCLHADPMQYHRGAEVLGWPEESGFDRNLKKSVVADITSIVTARIRAAQSA